MARKTAATNEPKADEAAKAESDAVRVREAEAAVAALEKRVSGVRQLKAGAERAGAAESIKLLAELEADVVGLLEEARNRLRAASPFERGTFGPATCAKILKHLREGLWLAHAADLAHVPRETARDWVLQGKREPRGPYGQFALEVSDARSEQTRRMWNRAVELAESGNGDLLLRLLERRDPDHFAPRQKIEIDIEGAKERMLQIAAKTLPHEQLEQLIAALGADGEETGA